MKTHIAVVIVFILFFTVHALSNVATAQNDGAGASGKVCECRTAEEILDPDAALMDGALFRALLAVNDFRNGKQKRDLRPSEFDLTNFHISVSRKPSAEKPNTYAVIFSVKSAPGEEAPKLAGTSLGRGYTYFVDKRTFRVVHFRTHE